MPNYSIGDEYDFSEVMAEASLPGNYELEVELIRSAVKERESNITFSLTTGGSITSEPLIKDGIAYVTVCDHNVYAIDMDRGKEIWRSSSKAPNVTGPMINGDRLYFCSYDGNLYALDRGTGRKMWRFNAGDRITSSPCVYRGMIYFGCRDGNIYAVDLRGRLKWKFRTRGPIGSSVTAHGDRIYTGSFDRNVYALDLEGRPVWRFAAGGETARPSVSDGTVYFGSFDQCMYALDMNGRMKWKFATDDAFDSGSSLTVHEGTVYFGSKDHNMYAVRDGRLLWKFGTMSMIFSEPIIDGGTVYFGSTDGNLYALDKETGRKSWSFAAGGPVLYLDKEGDRMVFGCYDCNLYCISTKGKLLWKFHTSLNYPSQIEPEMETTHEVIIKTGSFSEESPKAKEAGTELGDYGDLKGNYIGDDMRDYTGKPAGEGGMPVMKYKKGRGTYR